MDIDKSQLRRLDFSLLLVFQLLFRHRKATVVASELGLSQSAISHALGRLRDVFQDPLFTRLPDGFLPNTMAFALAPVIDEIIEAGSRALGAGGFDPSTSTRSFEVVTVDYVAALLAPMLRNAFLKEAPGIRFSLRFGAGKAALDEIRSNKADLAIGRFDLLPRDHKAITLSKDGYLVVMRKDHPFGRKSTLEQYLESDHLLVSFSGEHYGSADHALLSLGHVRRVVASVPLFMAALATVSETDLLSTVPARLAQEYMVNFKLKGVAPPFAMEAFQLSAVTHVRRSNDAGLNWLLGLLHRVWSQGQCK